MLIDKAGEVIDERQIMNDEAVPYLEKHVPKDTFAILEATRNWPFMYDLLAKHVVRVELANPKELKAISAAAVTRLGAQSSLPTLREVEGLLRTSIEQ